MRVGLFIPCYVDWFYPQVGMATVEILERLGVPFDFPDQQTCCGQPMANAGCLDQARPLASRFLEVFSEYTHVVAPSGSCVAMVRHHFGNLVPDHAGFPEVCERTYELCEFLLDVLEVESFSGSFPHRVGLHQSCHGLRELRLGGSSERVEVRPNKVRSLLEGLDDISLTQLDREDECCGFGGTFAVSEEAVSCRMGLDRLEDHQRAGSEIITSADASCLMHLEGLARRQYPEFRFMHVAEILAGRPLPGDSP